MCGIDFEIWLELSFELKLFDYEVHTHCLVDLVVPTVRFLPTILLATLGWCVGSKIHSVVVSQDSGQNLEPKSIEGRNKWILIYIYITEQVPSRADPIRFYTSKLR